MTRRTLALAVGVAVTVCVAVFWPREPPGPRERIERRVVEMTQAAQEKEISGVLEGVSERFRSAQGWDKQQLRGVLMAQLLRGQWVRVFLTDLQIVVETGEKATVSGTFLFARSEAKTVAELSRDSVVDAWSVDAVVELEADGEWRFVSSEHHRPNLTDLIR